MGTKHLIISVVLALSTTGTLGGCANPEVVQIDQVGDDSLACDGLKGAIQDAERFEREARHDRGLTGTNVAAAALFWPALIGTYMNTDEAIDAAKTRQERLTARYRTLHCA